MIKYRTGGFGKNLIEEVTVIKETAKQLVILEPATKYSKQHEVRLSKDSRYHQFHDTWEYAHAYLLAKAERRVESARMNLEREEEYYGNIKGLKKPTSQEGSLEWESEVDP